MTLRNEFLNDTEKTFIAQNGLHYVPVQLVEQWVENKVREVLDKTLDKIQCGMTWTTITNIRGKQDLLSRPQVIGILKDLYGELGL